MKKLLVFVLACMLLLSTAAFAASAEPADTTCSHSRLEEVVIKEAGCEEKGEKKLVCLDCGETIQTIVTPATGHHYVETVVAPTCTNAGYTQMTCVNCGDSYAVKGSETPALGHEFTETVVEATCAHDGSVTRTCSRCGLVETEVTPALEHSYVYQNDAVVGQDGSIVSYGTKVCSVCGAIANASAEDYAAANTSSASGEPSGEASSEASGEASGEAAAETATEVVNPNYDPDSYNWTSICIVLTVVTVVIGAILMLSFGKKKEDEVHTDPLN